MVRLGFLTTRGPEGREYAQGELFFGRILRVWCRFARSLFWGNPLLLEVLVRFIPGAELRGRLIEDHAHGKGDFRGHQDEKHEALPLEIATTCFIA